MTFLDLTRVQAGARDIDFAAGLAAFGRWLLRVLVFLVAFLPYSIAWTVTMVVRIAIAAAREGSRAASAQLGAGGS